MHLTLAYVDYMWIEVVCVCVCARIAIELKRAEKRELAVIIIYCASIVLPIVWLVRVRVRSLLHTHPHYNPTDPNNNDHKLTIFSSISNYNTTNCSHIGKISTNTQPRFITVPARTQNAYNTISHSACSGVSEWACHQTYSHSLDFNSKCM